MKRANKLWTNDNIHIHKILKIPVKVDSQFYNEDLEVSAEDDDSTSNQLTNVEVQNSNHTDKGVSNPECETVNGHDLGSKGTALSFLSLLDARIKNSKQESEKLRYTFNSN